MTSPSFRPFSRFWLPVFSFALLACSPPPPTEEKTASAEAPVVAAAPTCTLRMGYDPYEPYQFVDIEGHVQGLDVELVNAMAQLAQCDIQYEQKEWATLINELRDGKIDVLAGATRNPDRENFALFSKPYREESFALFIRHGEVDQWTGKNIDVLVKKSKMRIGITDGYVYGDEVNQLLDNSTYSKQFTSASMSEVHFANLIDQKIDGLLEDPFVAAAIIRHKNLAEQVNKNGVSVGAGKVHLMFSKASVKAETVAQFDMALDTLQTSGRYNEIIERYLKN